MNVERDYFWFQLFKTRDIGTKSLIKIAKILEKKNATHEISSWNHSDLLMQHPELAEFFSKIREEDENEVREEYEVLKGNNVDIIYPSHPDLPPCSLKIAPILFIKGNRRLLASNGVAIVGSRNVSDKGICIAGKIAAELANEALNVVSGYAKGVDSKAHLSALAAEGTTTIVLPYGINELRQKRALKEFDWQREVLAVSQFSPDVKWLARNAMVRNNLICTLSKAVVVIESGPERDAQGKMSGTFNTAQTARRMKMPLFVINPECFDNPPKGNKDLIDLGGERLDPDGAAETISKRISAANTKPRGIEEQSSPKQLEFLSVS